MPGAGLRQSTPIQKNAGGLSNSKFLDAPAGGKALIKSKLRSGAPSHFVNADGQPVAPAVMMAPVRNQSALAAAFNAGNGPKRRIGLSAATAPSGDDRAKSAASAAAPGAGGAAAAAAATDGKQPQQLQQQPQQRPMLMGFRAPRPPQIRQREPEVKKDDRDGELAGGDAAAAAAGNNDGDGKDGGPGPARPPNDADSKPDSQEESNKLEPIVTDVKARLPVSARGKLYFYVAFKTKEVSSDKNGGQIDKTGIMIVNVADGLTRMYDRSGRCVGNLAGGYLKEKVETLAAGAGKRCRVGVREMELLTAVEEVTFRTGEFFLRSDHEQRIRETKQKELAAKKAEEVRLATKKRVSLGGDRFASHVFRQRPTNTGFIVPVAGRPKTDKKTGLIIGGDLVPLHDPDGPDDPLVLFRADYKKDLAGNRIVSVVVDPVLGKKLRPHQREGVKFLWDCVTGEKLAGFHGAILADEMGLGKTLQAVTIIWTCLKQGKYGRPVTPKAVVVAPSSLVANWVKEFDKWLGPGVVKCFAIAESTKKGDRILSRFEGEGDVLVISYDQLRKYVERLKKLTAIDLIMCDEGHRLKNADIKTTKAVDMMLSRRRIVLSGTPIQNNLEEFHAMVAFVNPGVLGNVDLFTRVFQQPIMLGREPDCDEYTRELGSDRSNYLALTSSKFILRRTQTINEKYLPAKVDMTVFCRLGEEQRKVYERVHAVHGQFSSAPLVLITALKKLCNHVDLLYDVLNDGTSALKLPKDVLPKGYKPGDKTTDGTYGSKLEFVDHMLDEIPKYRDKLVIVSNYTQTLEVLARLCKKKNVAFYQLDGTTAIKKRQELVDRFNAASSREIVFLLSSKAGGVGLNLIGANRLILFDPSWNPADDAQAMGRVWRDGQKKKVFLYRLLCTGTIEEKIYQRQVSKQGLAANVVDMQQDAKQHFAMDELKALFSFRPDSVCETHDLLGCKCLVKRDRDNANIEFKFKAHAPARREGQGGPRMDELKSWQHVDNPAAFSLDVVTQAIAAKSSNLISFMFANERDAQKLVAGGIVKDAAVQGLEDTIVCKDGAEGEDGLDEAELEMMAGRSQLDMNKKQTSSDDDGGSSDDDDDDDENAGPRGKRQQQKKKPLASSAAAAASGGAAVAARAPAATVAGKKQQPGGKRGAAAAPPRKPAAKRPASKRGAKDQGDDCSVLEVVSGSDDDVDEDFVVDDDDDDDNDDNSGDDDESSAAQSDEDDDDDESSSSSDDGSGGDDDNDDSSSDGDSDVVAESQKKSKPAPKSKKANNNNSDNNSVKKNSDDAAAPPPERTVMLLDDDDD